MSVLSVKNLTKRFGSFVAVDDISFEVAKGQVVGLLGPNGAGKSTTIHMLLGLTLPTRGQIIYFGHSFTDTRQNTLQRINYSSAFNTLQGRISSLENLLVFARLYQVKDAGKKIIELAEYFEAVDLLKQRFWDLSAGQKTRINLIKSMLNDPEIILMDEPTASLDPDIADKTLSLIEEMIRLRNLTVLFTSHNMNEVTRICDDVIFLDHGTIVAHDTPVGLTKQIPEAQLRLTFDNERKMVEDYLKAQNLKFTFENDSSVIIETHEERIPKIIFGISKAGVYMTDIGVKKPDLEDVFLQIARKNSHVISEN